MRQGTKTANEFAIAVPIEDSVNVTAAAMSSFFRPRRSLSAPETAAPNRQPTRAQLIAQPISKELVRLKYFS
jgi:hypothetical protein